MTFTRSDNNLEMKKIIDISILIGIFLVVALCDANAQISPNPSSSAKEYVSLGEALKNPSDVYRLNLSDQNFKELSDSIWSKFENLEYLSLKNDHLKEIPAGIGNLKNLQVLDLSNNDFTVLPESFSRLENLKELYLNGEKKMDFNQSLRAIKDLPNLKILHLENDNLESIPKGLLEFTQLEALYLNNNNFNEIPVELENLKNLNYIDFNDNQFKFNTQDFQSPFTRPGITIDF